MDVGVHIDPFKPQVFQLLSGFHIPLGVQESPFEGVQEVVSRLGGLVCSVIDFSLFLYERIHLLPLDECHGEGILPLYILRGGTRSFRRR